VAFGSFTRLLSLWCLWYVDISWESANAEWFESYLAQTGSTKGFHFRLSLASR